MLTDGVGEFILLGCLASVHLASALLRHMQFVPRSRLLSAAGGIVVAFVFLQLLPGLAADQAALSREGERAAYTAALFGLVLTYGTQRALARPTVDVPATPAAARLGAALASYALLNGIVGYLLIDGRHLVGGRGAFALGMAMKFVVTDRGLAEEHGTPFDLVGRPVVIAALAAGGVAAAAISVPLGLIAGVRAFLTGGVLLVVLKEELPAEREASFPAFALSVLGAAVLLHAASP